MKLDPRFKLTLAVSTDDHRQHITCAHLDVEAKLLVATTGHFAAMVPVTVEPGDRSGPVPIEALRMLVRGFKATAKRSLLAVGNVLFRRPAVVNPLSDPKTRKSIAPPFKRGDEGTVSVGLSAAFLHRLAKALGANDLDGVVLTFDPKAVNASPYLPVLVEPASDVDHGVEGAIGFLMPRKFEVGK